MCGNTLSVPLGLLSQHGNFIFSEWRHLSGNTSDVLSDTHSEHRERYVACCSLVSDLMAYCKKKQAQDAAWTPSALHKRVTEGLKNSPELELTPAEFQWVMRELSTAMDWQISEGDMP